MRTFIASLLALQVMFSWTVANSAVLIDTLPEFSFDGDAPFPSPSQYVGTFNFSVPFGDGITLASVSGTFGNSQSPSSAAFDLYGDGLLLGSCVEFDPCYYGPYQPFTFALPDFSVLSDGTLILSIVQNSEAFVRLSGTTLTIVTAASAVPLPGALPLFTGGLGGLWLLRRIRRRNGEAAA